MPSAENWWSLGQILGSVLGGALLGFLALYRSSAKREESGNEKIVANSIGAAFVDRTVAQNIAVIADKTTRLCELVETKVREEQEEDREEQRIQRAMQRLREEEEALKRQPPVPGKPGSLR